MTRMASSEMSRNNQETQLENSASLNRRRTGIIRKALHPIVACAALPCLLSLVVYYGFGSNYTGGVFHKAGFLSQYEHGIYKYRVLGRILLLGTHRFMTSETLPARVARRLFANLPASARTMDNQADPTFYAAYFVQNTFFLIMCSLILYMLLIPYNPEELASSSGPYMVGVLLIALSQYVVCPYDNLSYFLFLLSVLLIVRPFSLSFVLLSLVLAVSTLARESSALTLPFYFAFHFRQGTKLNKKDLSELLFLGGTFLATYALLRVFLGSGDHPLYEDVRLVHNFRDLWGVSGILLLPVVSYLLCTGSRNKKRCITFLLASSPYVLGMLIVGRTWEARLWVPIWLGLLILTRDIPLSAPRRSQCTGALWPTARACR